MPLMPSVLDCDPQVEDDPYEESAKQIEGFSSDPLEDVVERYADLVAVVDASIECFQQRDLRFVTIHPGSLTLAEKLHQLSHLAEVRHINLAVPLHACASADWERQRILQAYYADGRGEWTYQLCSLVERLATAAQDLEDAIQAELQRPSM
jgi:hypothetical protein